MKSSILVSTLILSLLMIPSQKPEAPSEEEAQRMTSVGERVARQLTSELVSALGKAIKEGGPEAAIEVCSQKAQVITQSITAEMPNISVKRTTLKYRNPANAPDSLDLEALHHFEESSENSKERFYLQKAKMPDHTVLRYYQPLKVASVCLNCHGTSDRIPENVRREIDRRYPDDLAKGYQTGDFRGVIRVEMRTE